MLGGWQDEIGGLVAAVRESIFQSAGAKRITFEQVHPYRERLIKQRRKQVQGGEGFAVFDAVMAGIAENAKSKDR